MLLLSKSHSRALHHNFSFAFIVSISVVIEHSRSSISLLLLMLMLLMNFHRFEIRTMSLCAVYILFFSAASKTIQLTIESGQFNWIFFFILQLMLRISLQLKSIFIGKIHDAVYWQNDSTKTKNYLWSAMMLQWVSGNNGIKINTLTMMCSWYAVENLPSTNHLTWMNYVCFVW